ncbi:MAG: T9SS type A sorting domain-containing protein [Bacteroidota bacterium]|nr:T9SS type A sorting domain-containing protein [Bacteroidota bacterium]
MKPWLLLFLWQIPRLLFAQTDTMNIELTNGSIKMYPITEAVRLNFSQENMTVDDVQKINAIFASFLLRQNYPNPFNPTTTIEYEIPKAGNVEVAIFDIQGRKIRELEKSVHDAGSFRVVWDSRNDAGRTVSSGTYFYRVQFNGSQLVNKLLLLK